MIAVIIMNLHMFAGEKTNGLLFWLIIKPSVCHASSAIAVTVVTVVATAAVATFSYHF